MYATTNTAPLPPNIRWRTSISASRGREESNSTAAGYTARRLPVKPAQVAPQPLNVPHDTAPRRRRPDILTAVATLPPWLAFTPMRAAVVGLLFAACEHTQGEVEINWTIVDRAGAQVFPSGELTDLCAFTGLLTDGDTKTTPYDLSVRLRLCDPGCPAGCDDPSCLAVEAPIDYPCNAARGFSSVPARADPPYDFHVELVATADDATCGCIVSPPCALVPGPRTRAVEAGLVTDLQVYLLVLGLDDVAAATTGGRTRLDLTTCCTPDPSCA